MKRFAPIIPLCLSLGLLSGCSSEEESLTLQGPDVTQTVSAANSDLFPVEDGAKELEGTPAQQVRALLDITGPGIIKSLYNIRITDEQFQEIEAFTTQLTDGSANEREKYEIIFKWICSNVKYGYASNDPYDVFKNHAGVCQGYANLLATMCFSQGIPTMIMSGGLYYPLNWHAWNYLYADGKWIVSDPTNGGSYAIENESSYEILIPLSADADLFEDEQFVYGYTQGHLNVLSVKPGKSQVTVPYSVAGYVLTSFNPTSDLPSDLCEIYLGKNIQTLGEFSIGLQVHAANLEAVHVDEANPVLMSHAGILYKREDTSHTPLFIPPAMKHIEFLPMAVAGKNVLVEHQHATEVVFPAGTERIEAYAIENCPNVRFIYVPEDAVIEEDAFYNVAPDVQIIRGVPSGIHHVTL